MDLRRRLIVAAFLGAYVFTNAAGGAYMLCFGADGHVTVEAPGTVCCPGDSTDGCSDPCEPPSASIGSPMTCSSCGGCTDIPIPTGTSARVQLPKPQTRDSIAHDPWLDLASHFALIPSSVRSFAKPSPGVLRLDGTLLRLRTVVLRR